MSWQVYPAHMRRIRFSRIELRHIALALVVLVAAFALAFSGGIRGGLRSFPGWLLVASIAVPTGFLLHELGHKVVAQRYGHMAEFRAYVYGLFLAIITASFGFLFAAPGAVVIGGYIDQRQNGRISAAGPVVNLGIGGVFLATWFFLRAVGVNPGILAGMTAFDLTFYVALVNLILGTFNMMPFPPLDGSKVLRWDLRVYGLLLGANVSLLITMFVV